MIDELAEDIADDLADVFEDDPRIQRQLLTRALEGDGSFIIVLLDPHASERTSTCQSAELRVGNEN